MYVHSVQVGSSPQITPTKSTGDRYIPVRSFDSDDTDGWSSRFAALSPAVPSYAASADKANAKHNAASFSAGGMFMSSEGATPAARRLFSELLSISGITHAFAAVASSSSTSSTSATAPYGRTMSVMSLFSPRRRGLNSGSGTLDVGATTAPTLLPAAAVSTGGAHRTVANHAAHRNGGATGANAASSSAAGSVSSPMIIEPIDLLNRDNRLAHNALLSNELLGTRIDDVRVS